MFFSHLVSLNATLMTIHGSRIGLWLVLNLNINAIVCLRQHRAYACKGVDFQLCHVDVCVCMYMWACLWFPMWVCVFYVSICVFYDVCSIRVCIFVCFSCVHVSVCVFPVCLCMLCSAVHICVCVCVHMHVCLCECVCHFDRRLLLSRNLSSTAQDLTYLMDMVEPNFRVMCRHCVTPQHLNTHYCPTGHQGRQRYSESPI